MFEQCPCQEHERKVGVSRVDLGDALKLKSCSKIVSARHCRHAIGSSRLVHCGYLTLMMVSTSFSAMQRMSCSLDCSIATRTCSACRSTGIVSPPPAVDMTRIASHIAVKIHSYRLRAARKGSSHRSSARRSTNSTPK